ncbi:MAG TPA: hypothetical protein VIK72_19470 [Clostridiaceae bacterium]
MNKSEFEEMEIVKQLEYVNDLLAKGDTLTKAAHYLGIGRTSIARNFKKASYIYDSISKQYVKTNIPQEDKKDNTPIVDKKKKLSHRPKEKLDHKLSDKLQLDIPIKAKARVKTKAFGIVMDIALADKLDKLAKSKGGYSRNEIVNIICKLYIDNMDDK